MQRYQILPSHRSSGSFVDPLDLNTYLPEKIGISQRTFFSRLPIQGCQIFLGTAYQHGEKYNEKPLSISNGPKIYQKWQ
jgi:hypothetical protein